MRYTPHTGADQEHMLRDDRLSPRSKISIAMCPQSLRDQRGELPSPG